MSFSMATDRIPFQQMMSTSFHVDGSLTLPSMKLTIRADACPLDQSIQPQSGFVIFTGGSLVAVQITPHCKVLIFF